MKKKLEIVIFSFLVLGLGGVSIYDLTKGIPTWDTILGTGVSIFFLVRAFETKGVKDGATK